VYEQTQQEHEQLRERIKFLHQRIDVRPASPDEIARLLRELRDALVTHFRNEEHDGFFDQIVTRAPQLSRQAQKLTHEHVDFLQHADALIQLAESCAGEPICPATLAAGFHDFSKLLMHHESEENGMLQSAYQDDLGTKD
jgi:iron-sulfur cluster repair protein YtfE (RIC family)